MRKDLVETGENYVSNSENNIDFVFWAGNGLQTCRIQG
jgi:hypothetical protein